MIKDLTVATWNVRGITHKADEVDMELKNRTDIAVMFKTRRIKDGELYSDIFWNTKRRMGLIGCISTSYCTNRIIKYECISPRIVKLRSLNIHSNNTRHLHSS
jgi:hypothetical protein